MASFNRGPDDAVIVSGRVLSVVVGAALNHQALDSDVRAQLEAAPHVAGLSLDLLTGPVRHGVETALKSACREVLRSEPDEALVLGARSVLSFLESGGSDGA